MKMKMDKMSVIVGSMPSTYDPYTCTKVINLLNEHSMVINHLTEVIESQEKEIKILKDLVERKENEQI